MHVQQQNEENATHMYLEKEKIFEQQVKTIIIPISIYRNKHKHNTNSRCKKNRERLVQFYEANHLYMMIIALIKRIYKINTTSRYHLSVVKTTYHIKSEEKVQNFAVRWRSICKYFITPNLSDKRKQTRSTTKYRIYPVTP